MTRPTGLDPMSDDLFEQLELLPLDPAQDGFFFNDCTAVPREDRSRIHRLGESSALALWDHVVGERADVPLLVRGGWVRELIDNGERVGWQQAWNADDFEWAGRVAGPRLGWDAEDSVFMLWSPRYVLNCSFGVFVRYWMTFLYDDEGPFLIHPTRPEVLLFDPRGEARLGWRHFRT